MDTYKRLIAISLFAATTATVAHEAQAQNITGSYTRTVGTGEISARLDETGGVNTLSPTKYGVATWNDLRVNTKFFSKSASPLIYVSASSQAWHGGPGSASYDEWSSAYTYVDGKMLGPTSAACHSYDTCSTASTGIEKTLWKQNLEYPLFTGVTLKVTASLAASASVEGYARTYSGPGALGVGNHHVRTKATTNGSVNLNANLSGSLNVPLYGSVGLYGKTKIIALDAELLSTGNTDVVYKPAGATGTASTNTVGTHTLSTGSGELGFSGSVCLPCVAFPLTPFPVYTSYDKKLTDWGPLYSATSTVWNKSYVK